jgi:hypothetical protein
MAGFYEIRSECNPLSKVFLGGRLCFLNLNNHSHFTRATIGNVFYIIVCNVEVCEMYLKLRRHFRPKEEEFCAQMNDVIVRRLIEHSKH